MKSMLINAAHKEEELRIALVNNKLLYDLIIERPGQAQKVGNIYKGKITSIEPSLNAVFVNYGAERHGFLPLKEISSEYFQKKPSSGESSNIKELLKEGQEVVIQIEKEERGTKGAALTTFITLAGSYLVLMPNNPSSGGVSRRIEGEERETLREHLTKLEIPEEMGVIVRTAGLNKELEDLKWDFEVLLEHYKAIKAASETSTAPFLIHRESDIITRTIRDYLRADISEIVVDDPEVYQRIHDYLHQVRPQFTQCLKRHTGSTPIFNHYKIEHQIETAYQRDVQLPSGGSVVIDHTEALVSIDINSARATKGGNIEETAFQTNCEAAEEIARQIRLRDIGGLIVIDFIDMTPAQNQRKVENHLRNALHLDRARVQIGRISRFGLLEMSRQRLRSSLQEGAQNVCPRCNGQGTIRGVESLALSILRILEEDALKERITQIQLQLPIDVCTFLLNDKRDNITNIEKEHNIDILLIPNPNLQTPQYRIKRIQGERTPSGPSRTKPSHKMIESPEVKMPHRTQRQREEEPAVQAMMPSRPSPRKGTGKGLFKRLVSGLFGEKEKTSTPTDKQRQNQSSSSQQRSRKPYNKAPGSRSPRGRGNTRTGGTRGSAGRHTHDNRRSDRRSDTRPEARQADSNRRTDTTRQPDGNRRTDGHTDAQQADRNRRTDTRQPDGNRRTDGHTDAQQADRNRRTDDKRTGGRRPSDSRRSAGGRRRTSSDRNMKDTTSPDNRSKPSNDMQTDNNAAPIVVRPDDKNKNKDKDND